MSLNPDIAAAAVARYDAWGNYIRTVRICDGW